MGKRKRESSLISLIISHLKKAKCVKTIKLLEGKLEENNEDVKVSEQFLNYLKAKEVKKEIENDDLGFIINFGAYQSQPKVSPSKSDQVIVR